MVRERPTPVVVSLATRPEVPSYAYAVSSVGVVERTVRPSQSDTATELVTRP